MAVIDLDSKPFVSRAPGRGALSAILAAGAFALLAFAPEHQVAAETRTTSIVIVAQPADRAAAVIHRADGSTIDTPPIGQQVILAEPPASVQVLLFGENGTDPVSCAIVIDGQVLDQSGPAGVASCQWDAPARR